ncbi:MAG: XRE family transcriptional regulator [Planctomycetaceae bacterium]|nr:XRE family transcriptional regulator [Planctomycetaceae bacterium]
MALCPVMLGIAVRGIREKRGFSVRQFAAMLGKTPGYISRIEVRGEIPSPELLLRIAELLEADPNDLLRLAKESQLANAEKEINDRHATALTLFRKQRR